MKLKLRLVTLFALLVSTTTWGQGNSEIRSKADALFSKESYIDATQLYLQLLSLDPKDVDLNYRYGVCLLHNSDNKSEAIRYLNYVVKENPNSTDALFFLGKAYHLGYNFEQARVYFTQYIQKAGPKGKYLQDAKQNIQMSRNGEKLLSNITDIHVKEKLEVKKENFYRGYTLDDVGGTLIQAVDFQSKVDKKKGHKPIVHILPSSDLIYFSSYGDGDNLDIYVIRRLPDGQYGSAQKIKGEVNTSFDEDFPYMHPNGKELFFSSKGHSSIGGYDIFRATFDPENNQFITVNNIDFAISSPDDDLLYIVDKDYKNAYFASNRQAKNGMISLYKVAVDRFPSELVILKGTFSSKINNDFKQISIDVFDDQTNRKIGRFQTNEQGNYVVVLPRGGKYVFKSSSSQFTGNFSQVVEVPHLGVIKPLRQYAEHLIKNGEAIILFVNAFDEFIENSSEVISEAFKLKGNLVPNEAPLFQKEVISSISNLSKATQLVGLPDWNPEALFAHIDDLGNKYINESEKISNLEGVQNATVFSELQKIEKIDLQLVNLTQQLDESPTNTQERSIQERINQLNDQRQESTKWLDILEGNRSAVLLLFENNLVKNDLSIDQVNQMVSDLHSAKAQGDQVFFNTLLKYEKEIKTIDKDHSSIYKSVLTDKVVLDKKTEKVSSLENTNKNRLEELNGQLVQLKDAVGSAKTKQKETLENLIEHIENEVNDINENINLLNKQKVLLQVQQDSIVQLIQAIGRIEQFKGTPVSPKMLNTAKIGYNNSVVTKGELRISKEVGESTVIAKVGGDTNDLGITVGKSSREIKDQNTTNSGNTEEKKSTEFVIKSNEIEENLPANGNSKNGTIVGHSNDVETSVVGKTEVKNVTPEINTRNDAFTAIASGTQNSTSIPSTVGNSIEKTIQNNGDLKDNDVQKSEMLGIESSNSSTSSNQSNQSDKTLDVSKGVNNFLVISTLSNDSKEYVKSIDKNYFTRVEKLEQRKLNAGEQRVLIDLHRKFLEKIEEEQGQITFQERKPKMDGEIELLDALNLQVTQSIQNLNQHLSDEMDEFKVVPSEKNKVVPDAVANVVQDQSTVNTNEVAVSSTVQKVENEEASTVSVVQNGTPSKGKEDDNSISIEKTIQNSSLQSNEADKKQDELQIKDENSVIIKKPVTRSPEVLALEQSIQTLNTQMDEKKEQLQQTKNNKEKKIILSEIQSLEREMDEQIIALNELNFDLLFDQDKYHSDGELSDLEKQFVQSIEETNSIYQNTKDKTDKRLLSGKRLVLVEDLVDWSDYQNQTDYLELARRETISLISKKELEALSNYLILKQADLAQLMFLNSNWVAKKKTDKIKKHQNDILYSDLLLENEALQQFVKKKIDQENKYVIKSKESFIAPSYPEEYKILASEEYEAFATLKVREQELDYAIHLLSIQLEEAREKAHRLYFENAKNDKFKEIISEIEKLETIRSLRMNDKLILANDLAVVTPKDASSAAHFNNLVQRGQNPIIHKQLQGELVELGGDGINFLHEPNLERKELALPIAKGLVYRVQVGAFKNPIASHVFSEFSPVTTEVIPNSSVKRFIAGYFPSIKMADEAKKQIHSLGYNDAFIVAYCDGERVSIQRAKELEKEGSCSVGYLENITFEINKDIHDKAIKIDREKVDFSKINQSDYNKGLGMVSAEALEDYDGLFFTVQVGVYNRPTTADRFYNQKPLFTLRSDIGQIRYSIGSFTELSAAREREKELRSIGLHDAYVVAYYKGERISLAKALDIIDSGVKPGFVKKGNAPIPNSETNAIVKEEVPIFKSVPRLPVQLPKEYVQLISIDSFTTIPVDFLDRFRPKSYFYFDHVDGRVKSQIVEKQHYLVDLESLRKFFFIENNQLLLQKQLTNSTVLVSIDNEKIPSDLADYLLRISNRFELKELDKGIEILIFVNDDEDFERIENSIKSLGYSSEKILKNQRK